MSGEDVSRSRAAKRYGKGLTAARHEIARAFEYRERGVPLIEMASLAINFQRPEQPPATDPPVQFPAEGAFPGPHCKVPR